VKVGKEKPMRWVGVPQNQKGRSEDPGKKAGILKVRFSEAQPNTGSTLENRHITTPGA